MDRCAFAPDDGADRCMREEVGLGLDRCRMRAVAQVKQGGVSAERVGKGHERAAMQNRGGRAEILAHRHLADDSIRLGFDQLYPEQRRERLVA